MKDYREGRIIQRQKIVDSNPLIDVAKTAFLAIPKTGNTSVKISFLRYFGIDIDVTHKRHVATHDRRLMHYETVFDVYKHFGHYFKFAFVRNPWDRFVSLWYNQYSNRTFENFIESLKHSDININIHMVSQHFFVECQGKRFVDYIGKVETMDDDWDNIRRKISVELPDLEKWQVSKERLPYRDIFTTETRKIVEERYSKDIKMFGYSY